MKTYLVVRNNFQLVKIKADTKTQALSKVGEGQGEYIEPTPRQLRVIDKLSCITAKYIATVPSRWLDTKAKEKLDKKKLRELLRQIHRAI